MLKIFNLLKLFRKDLIAMLLALRHPDTPRRVKGLFIVGLVYLLSPIDFLPDAIPFFGILDDVAIVPGMIYGLMQLLPYHVRRESESRASQMTRHLPLLLGAATLFVLFWVGMLVWGIVSLFRTVF